MTIRNLNHAFEPRSVAVIGASCREGSVGSVVLGNILKGGFEGEIWPVNPKYSELTGRRCYATVNALPSVPDLAVIMTPADTVPALIGELGEKGTRAAVVLTAGLTEANGLKQKMLDAARPHLLRIIGPNCLGLILPHAKLNAGFFHMAAAPGDIALLSQSGAIAASLIDWAAANGVGFSQIVSLGDMADVDVGDCLDRLAADGQTRAIVLYLESVPNPRKFMSAARATARVKPVIAIKPGRHAEAAKAAATHTGALSGADGTVDAVLRRAGILRIHDLAELFDATETLARFAPLDRARVGIVTNGGGAGVLAVDRLMDFGIELAVLSSQSLAELDRTMSANWSRANPVDIVGDASPERYRAAVETVAADPAVDVLLVMNCPTGMASSLDAAAAVAALAREGRIHGKPVLSCWLGEATAREARHLLQTAGITTYDTPDAAATAVSYLTNWSRAQNALQRVPAAAAVISADQEAVHQIFRQVVSEHRRMLTEPEAKAVAKAYGIPVPETIVARTAKEVERASIGLLKASGKVAVKLLSKGVSHKSDVGGVVLNIETATAARDAAQGIKRRLQKHAPTASIDGFAVQPMIERKNAIELILGISRDPLFGPVILFGAGGVAVEVMNDTAIALPPLDDVLAGDLIDGTRVGRLLAGFRDRKPADRASIIRALIGLSQMIVDFPCIVAADINPLLADPDGVVALDARIEIDPDMVEQAGPNPALIIRPYPAELARDVAVGDRNYYIRPIRPGGLLDASDGRAMLLGRAVDPHDIEIRRRVGYMSQGFSLYSDLTVRQNLLLHARLFGLPADGIAARVDEVARQFDLTAILDAWPDALPLGSRQRLSLAVAMVHAPDILILDEPTSGVDPVARDAFWSTLVDLSRRQSVTVFVSTHFMNEAERCDRVALMHAGKVLVSDTPAAIMASRNTPTLEEAFVDYLEDAEADGRVSSGTAADPVTAGPDPIGTRSRSPFDVRRMYAYSRRESLELLRDPIRATLATIGSLILMFVIGYGINMDVENLTFAVLDRDDTSVSRNYTLQLSGSRYFIEKAPLAGYVDMDRRMESGEIALALEIPPDFARDLARGREISIGAWIDGAMPARAETVRGYVERMHQNWLAQKSRENESGTTPGDFRLEVRYRYNPDLRSLDAMAPAVIPMLLLMIPSMLAVLSVVREKELGSIVNFYVTPVTRLEFLLGKQLPYVGIAMLNFVFLTAFAVFAFHVPLTGSLATLTAAAFLYVVVATAMGLFLSTFMRSQIAAIFGTVLITMIPAAQYSGMIDPVSSLEGAGAFIGQIYPATYFMMISRGVFSKGLGFDELSGAFVPLLIAIPVLIGLSTALLRKQER